MSDPVLPSTAMDKSIPDDIMRAATETAIHLGGGMKSKVKAIAFALYAERRSSPKNVSLQQAARVLYDHWKSLDDLPKPVREMISKGHFFSALRLIFDPGADLKRPVIEAASRISQQDAELERLRREVEEAKEFRAILEGHLSAAIDDYNEVLKALEPFARVAEHDIGESEADSDFFMPMKTYNRAPLLTVGDFRNALALRAKAEETRT